MTFTYTPGDATLLGRVRLIIGDTDVDNSIFHDEEIGQFLALEDEDVRLASAMALETISTQEALILKVVKVGDLQTDGTKLAAELRARATQLRQEADETVGDYAEMVVNEFSYRERLRNQRLRNF